MSLCFKLDENIGTRGRSLLSKTGWNVCSVAEQNLQGYADRDLIQRCSAENRCLITLDLDFSNPIEYPPHLYAGIVVLRLPANPKNQDIFDCLNTFICASPSESLTGKLWIVSKNRIRIYHP